MQPFVVNDASSHVHARMQDGELVQVAVAGRDEALVDDGILGRAVPIHLHEYECEDRDTVQWHASRVKHPDGEPYRGRRRFHSAG